MISVVQDVLLHLSPPHVTSTHHLPTSPPHITSTHHLPISPSHITSPHHLPTSPPHITSTHHLHSPPYPYPVLDSSYHISTLEEDSLLPNGKICLPMFRLNASAVIRITSSLYAGATESIPPAFVFFSSAAYLAVRSLNFASNLILLV